MWKESGRGNATVGGGWEEGEVGVGDCVGADEDKWGKGWGVLVTMHDLESYGQIPSHSYSAGTEHVGFSRTRQTLLAPRAKRRGRGGNILIGRP